MMLFFVEPYVYLGYVDGLSDKREYALNLVGAFLFDPFGSALARPFLYRPALFAGRNLDLS